MHIQSQYWYFICTEKPSSGVKRIQLHCTDLRSTYIKTTNTYYCTYRQYTYMYIHVHIYIYILVPISIYAHTHTRIHILKYVVSLIHQKHVVSVLWVQSQRESCGIYEQS